MVTAPDLSELNEASLLLLQKDLNSWKEDFSNIIDDDAKFFFKSQDKSPLQLQ